MSERQTLLLKKIKKNKHLYDSTGGTLRIRRPPRVFTTDLGKNVWMGEVEPCELELELEVDADLQTNPYESGLRTGSRPRI